MEVYDTARQLAKQLSESAEYAAYAEAKAAAGENETTRVLIDEYHRLQIRAQAAVVSGKQDAEAMQKLQKIGELLQFDKIASQYLMAEFRLNRMLSDVYKMLADAVGIDLSTLEA